MVYKLP